MAEVTQELRDDIERIREDLDTTLDALGERVSPRRIAQRRKDAVRARVTRVRTAVMGSAQGTGSAVAGQARHAAGSVQEGASQAAEKVREAPQAIQQQTQGNPLAAGLVAFGAGMLLATLFPPTEAEQRAASAVQERAEPLKDRAVEAGREVKDHLQESARERAEQVKQTASDAAEDVKGEAQSSARGVTEQAKSSAEDIKEAARKSPASVARTRQSSSVQGAEGAHSGGAPPVHVVPRDDEWIVEREGATRASSRHRTQAEADDQGRAVARREGVELIVHGRDGRIRQRESYGNDPTRSEG